MFKATWRIVGINGFCNEGMLRGYRVKGNSERENGLEKGVEGKYKAVRSCRTNDDGISIGRIGFS